MVWTKKTTIKGADGSTWWSETTDPQTHPQERYRVNDWHLNRVTGKLWRLTDAGWSAIKTWTVRGTQWSITSGMPPASLGERNDFAIDRVTGEIYHKGYFGHMDDWHSDFSIKGPAGPKGATGSISDAHGDARYLKLTGGVVTGSLVAGSSIQSYMRNPTTPMLRPSGTHKANALLGYTTDRWKVIYSTTALAVSDPSTKKKMRPVDRKKLDPVLAARVIEFQWDDQDEHDTETQYGFDASEMTRLFPDSGFAKLHFDEEDPDFAGLHYMDTAQGLAVLWKAFQEHVEATDAKMTALEKRITALETP